MLWTLFVILLVLWLVGVVSSYTLGGFIHLLLVLALVALVFQLLSRTTLAACLLLGRGGGTRTPMTGFGDRQISR